MFLKYFEALTFDLTSTKSYKNSNVGLAADCEWNEWQTGECSRTCGGGTSYRRRTKKVAEKYGGTCDGESILQEPCNTEDCPGNLSVVW